MEMRRMEADSPAPVETISSVHPPTGIEANDQEKGWRGRSRSVCRKAVRSKVMPYVIFILTIISPILNIVFGSSDKNNCPIDPKIPIWMIVMGVSGIIQPIFKLIYDIMNKDRFKTESRVVFAIEKILQLFQLGWVIYGAVLIYPKYKRVSYDETTGGGDYCSKKVFQLSFLHITITFIVVGIIFLIIFMKVIRRKNANDIENQ